MDNLKCRKQGFNKLICKRTNKQITFNDCKNCEYKEYKIYKPLRQKSSKQAKLEKERFSLFTDDLSKCIICGKPKEHIHEIFPGSYRKQSIKYHMVLPLCFHHHKLMHEDAELCSYWKRLCQQKFEENYTRSEFIKIFGRSYL